MRHEHDQMRHEHDQMRHEHDQMRHELDQMRHEHDQRERKMTTYSLFDGQLYHLVGKLVLTSVKMNICWINQIF